MTQILRIVSYVSIRKTPFCQNPKGRMALQELQTVSEISLEILHKAQNLSPQRFEDPTPHLL
jgi:hypothetical protein